MKLALFLLLITTSLFAQTSKEITEKNLIGKWVFKDIAEDAGKDNGISLQERKEMLEGMYLLLREGGTCVTSFVLDKDGKWSFDAGAKVITIKEGMKTITWTVHSLSGNEIVLSRNDSKQKILFAKQ